MARAAKLYLSLALLFIANLSIARAQVVGGSISGGVHDASGATLSGATVTVRQIETGARTLTTDREGRFFAPSVPVGEGIRSPSSKTDLRRNNRPESR